MGLIDQRVKTMCMVLLAGFLLCFSTSSFASNDVEVLKKEVQTLKKELANLDSRINKNELHSATDRLSIGLEFRTRADSIHITDAFAAPSWVMGGFFGDFNEPNYNIMMGAFGTGNFTAFNTLMQSEGLVPVGTTDAQFASMIQSMMTSPMGVQSLMSVVGGFNGVNFLQAKTLMGMMSMANIKPNEYSADNEILYTNRLRLNLKAKINDNLDFAGRLSMYKVFGDSSQVQMMSGSMSDIYMDGNTASIPHDDILHVERVYFNLKDDIGPVPVNLSLGRRPATDGPPLEYGNYSLEGGSPLSTIINWQFDGASLSFGLEEVSGISGLAFKLCYGVGFESDWGNSYSMNGTSYVDDVHFGGFILSLYDDDNTSIILNYAHAWDITDGFAGTVVMPFLPYKNPDGTYTFLMNTGGFISRTEASSNIGDFDLASLLFRTNFSDLFANIDFFLAPSFSRTDPKRVSKSPFYELMGMGMLSNADINGNLDSHDGYSIYAGVIFPMPKDGRLGLEYNWGSKFWLNMTGAEDAILGSKMAARGHVYEAYYIQPIYGDNFFIKLGGQYYDYEYTGSGSPLGEPVEIGKMTAFDALFPVIDKAWNTYLSATVRF